MQLMLCIEGTVHTNTVTGQVYECVGAFVCHNCGNPSEILEFADPVEQWDSITCHFCGAKHVKSARYANKKRFIPLNDPDAEILEDERDLCTT